MDDEDLSAAVKQKLTQISTATLTSQLLIRGFRNTFIPGLIPMRPDLRMVGRAFTLRYVPSREDLGMAVHYDNHTDVQRLAVESIGPGEVLVIAARGITTAASFGHIIATRLQQRGAAGVVSDGGLRDTESFRSLDLPTYCRAPHATTSSVAHHPVEMNVPIGCGEVLVMSRDVVVGDAEGVVVIPSALASQVADDGYEQELVERFALEKVQEGAPINEYYPLADNRRREYDTWRQTSGLEPSSV